MSQRAPRAYGLFLLPALAINVVMVLIPAVLTVGIGFCSWDGVGVPEWAGLQNFENLVSDPVFWTALENNTIWTGIFLTVPVAIAMTIAILLFCVQRGRTVLQVIYFLPNILAIAIIGRVWQSMIFSPETGIFGWLDHHGIHLANPLASPDNALYGIAAADVWHWWGFLAVVFFAAIRQVDVSQIEAGRIDGARFTQLVRHIVIPGIRPTLALMLVMTVIWSFVVFDMIYILTKGGPAFGSEVLSTLAYRTAFFDFNVGGAAAASLVMSAFGLCATAVYIWLQQRERDI
jgi:raffinose/stachyose/melibiose transport system permease protein